MRRCRAILALLGLPATLAACEAGLGLGIGSRCAAEKSEVRRQRGPPDDTAEGPRSEIWFYNAGRITFEFSWDQTGENCEVRTSRFVRLPAAP